jgi:hypothetical protein
MAGMVVDRKPRSTILLEELPCADKLGLIAEVKLARPRDP